MLLHRLFAATVQRQPGKLALVCGERRLSYAELDARSRALAGHLRQWGVAPGERVGLLLENGVEMVCALWALLRIGAVCMPFNPQTKADKLGGMLARSGAAMLIAQPSLAPVWRDARRAAPELRRVVVADPDWQGRAGECGWPQGEAFAAASSDAATSPDALAFISHTSGTTGLPKGVMLSHRNLVCAVRAIAQYLAIRQDDVVFSALPLSFNYGLTQFLLACCTGATLVLERSFAFPAQALEIIARERATVFPAVPTMYAMLMAMRDLSRWDLSSLRLATSASAPLPLPLLQQVRARLPTAQLVVMYGQTECTRISYLPPEQLDERPDSVGRGLPGQRCWLIDEDGRRLPWGETGELVVQGDHVMLGYWEDPQRTCEKLFVDPASGRRAMRTGDLFRSDPQGWLYFAGRKDDIIKTRGEKVSPLEVERAIARLPGVRECLVGGVPDDLLGEAIKAWVVPEPGAALGERDVIRHCLASLENHMAPKHVAFVERLPRTATGKPTRQGLS
ncbi:class I adenylate-forming enzyme family protein [Pseudoxanthomonas mexicana]|uniref:class I adenylate-forming enzyme family protein n=1 Tax=Pseudoxanthomonas mexicana TaxID=128785 RepID=UPI00398BB365